MACLSPFPNNTHPPGSRRGQNRVSSCQVRKMRAKRWGVAAGDVEHWTGFAEVVAGAPLAQEAGGDDGISLSDTHDKEPRALKLSTTTKLAVRQTLDDATARHRLAELSVNNGIGVEQANVLLLSGNF